MRFDRGLSHASNDRLDMAVAPSGDTRDQRRSADHHEKNGCRIPVMADIVQQSERERPKHCGGISNTLRHSRQRGGSIAQNVLLLHDG
jgi:hypothetical protein